MIFLFLFICIIVAADTIRPKSVNLALDTVLEFNNKDNGDIEIIDNVQGFLNKIKNVLRDNSGRRSMNNDLTFTKFVVKFLETLKDYDDDDLEDAVAVFDDEMRKYHYGGCKFYEILQNNEMRRFIGHKLDSFRRKRPKDLRFDLEKYLKVIKNRKDAEVNKLFHYIDGMYPKKSRNKLKRFLSNIELYKSKSKRANLGLIKMIREGVRSIIFDHYSNLNVNARKDFTLKMETFWKNFANPSKVNHNVWNLQYTRSGNNEREDINLNSSPITKELDKITTDAIEKDTLNENVKPKLHVFEKNTEPTMVSKDVDSLREIQSERTTEGTTKSYKFNFMKELLSKFSVKPKETEKKVENVFGSFKDDVTNKDIVKEFEKSIDLHIPDIAKVVKQKFDSVTKEKTSSSGIFKDLRIKFDKDSSEETTEVTTTEWTTKRHTTKVRRRKTKTKKQKTPKRFSIVTTTKRVKKLKNYDMSEVDIFDESERYTTRKHKTKTTPKRKHKKDKNRSRHKTFYTENYTKKLKKRKTRTTKKQRQHKITKKLDRSRDKYKTKKVRVLTIGDYEEITEKTKKAKKYKNRHEKRSKHKKTKLKASKKPSKREKRTKKSRKLMKPPPTDNYEGMSIESFETQKSFRKNIDFDALTINQTSSINFNTTSVSVIINTTTQLTTEFTNTTDNSTILPTTTFGNLDFWLGTTIIPETASNTEVVGNITNLAKDNNTTDSNDKNSTNVLRRVDLNTTEYEIGNDKNATVRGNNETVRFVDDGIVFDDNTTILALNTTTNETTNQTTTVTLPVNTTKRKAKPKKGVKSKPKKATKIRNVTKTTKLTSTTEAVNLNNTIPFDLGEFFNKSMIFNVEDGRKSFLRDKVFQDMQKIFSPTSSTTEIGRTPSDPLDDFENALSFE